MTLKNYWASILRQDRHNDNNDHRLNNEGGIGHRQITILSLFSVTRGSEPFNKRLGYPWHRRYSQHGGPTLREYLSA